MSGKSNNLNLIGIEYISKVTIWVEIRDEGRRVVSLNERLVVDD